MGNCMDLSYGGNLISTYNGVIGGIDYDMVQEHDSLGVYESTTTMSRLSPFKRNHGGNYTDGLKRELHIAFAPPITHTELATFQETFLNSKQFKKMIYIDNDSKNDYFYMTKLVNPKYKEINNVICEVTCEVEYDSPYGYTMDGFAQTYNAKSNYSINNTSHFDGMVYPTIKIQGTGQITITNNTNGSKFIITLNSTTENVVITDKLQISTDDTTKKWKLLDVDLTNGGFFYLDKGVNSITIGGTGTLGKMEILFPICRKVGV